MTNKYYQKHEEKLWKEARERSRSFWRRKRQKVKKGPTLISKSSEEQKQKLLEDVKKYLAHKK